MLKGVVPSKVGSLAVLVAERVGVDIQKLLHHPDPWVLEAPPTDLQVARDLEVDLVEEVAASEVDSNNVEVTEAEVVVALAFKEAVASEDKTGMELPHQMPLRAPVVLAVVGFLGVEEVTVASLVPQIATVLAVGMIRVEEVAHMMTEAVEDIVATNEMDLRVAVLGATWSR